jgi:hypothetical protein
MPHGRVAVVGKPTCSPPGSTGQNLTYDARGNITAMLDQAMTYDQENRHVSTTDTVAGVADHRHVFPRFDRAMIQNGNPDVGSGNSHLRRIHLRWRYQLRDGRLRRHRGEGSVPARWGDGIGPGFRVSLAGGTQVWSYPNLHGDVTVTSQRGGHVTGTEMAIYDPFGDPIIPDHGPDRHRSQPTRKTSETRPPLGRPSGGKDPTRNKTSTVATSPPSKWEPGNTSRS